MRRCQELMLSSRASLSTIALGSGMCDQSHLTRVFRRIVGVNPGVGGDSLPSRQRATMPPEKRAAVPRLAEVKIKFAR